MKIKVPEAFRQAASDAERQDWSVTRCRGSKHLRFTPPEGAPDRSPVFVPSTPHGGNRSISNSIAKLRRRGLRTASQ